MIVFWLFSVILSLWIISLSTPPTCFFGFHQWIHERTEDHITDEQEGDSLVYSHWKTCRLCDTSKLEAIVKLKNRKPHIIIGDKELSPKGDRSTTGLEGALKQILGDKRQ